MLKSGNQKADGWQYAYAAKMIEGWPDWKKEIYAQNFPSSDSAKNKGVSAMCSVEKVVR